MSERGEIAVFPATDEHELGILALLTETLGRTDTSREAEFFRWKHERNPFGRSPMWVAVAHDEVVGLRTFLRWEFEDGDDIRHAVRAVDTATRRDYQGHGIFTQLTLAGLDALRSEGSDFVFNTPNDRSRPGYLKMGWQTVGKLRTAVRPTSPSSLPKIIGARRAAERWSKPSSAGVPAAEALADEAAVEALLSALPSGPRLCTHRTVEYLRWRYGWEELCYRALSLSADAAEGLALFRTRRRGAAVEASLCELLVPEGDSRVARRLVQAVTRAVDADYVLALAPPGLRERLIPLPKVGPTLTWRGLTIDEAPPRSAWAFTLGDIELF